MTRVAYKVGPADDGRRMSLEDFDRAEGAQGYLYELSRGMVTVTNVPNRHHFAQVNAIRRQVSGYESSHPDQIHAIAGGSDCKILIASLESERHPDLAIYRTPMPADEDLWAVWVPELVIEVVSPESSHRDYEEKPEEYLQFGVREYWIIDLDRDEMLVLRRSGGRWARRVVKPGERYRTRLLPDFEFDLAAVFEAARTGGRS
jgi:Uma2 family endonuclease